MKFVTFNIRCDRPQDGENQFPYRQPLIVRVIEREQPDVICFQEVEPHMAAWLKKSLPDYYVIGCGRGKTWTANR
jgi:endonuclease/exonuclease/phosphatase family metal-dependent hydrolase